MWACTHMRLTHIKYKWVLSVDVCRMQQYFLCGSCLGLMIVLIHGDSVCSRKHAWCFASLAPPYGVFSPQQYCAIKTVPHTVAFSSAYPQAFVQHYQLCVRALKVMPFQTLFAWDNRSQVRLLVSDIFYRGHWFSARFSISLRRIVYSVDLLPFYWRGAYCSYRQLYRSDRQSVGRRSGHA